jgi:MFS family permease
MSSANVTTGLSLFDKRRYIAEPGFNRWLVPPCALAIHLCIGMAYGFSVFWLPLHKALGITQSIDCPKDLGFFETVFSTTCDWKISMLGWMYTLFFVFLGTASAVWGGWLERVGPRKAGFAAAILWCGGLLISAFGVTVHQIWLLWLGSGVIGGLGLGLGYISPVSTLIKWFPDRRGMATGMAIMGFGGGAMIGAPLADRLMKLFATPTSVGVWQAFIVLAAGYFIYMIAGSFGYRLPAAGWKPQGWEPKTHPSITTHNVGLNEALKTPQFWLVWAVLCLNVTAGIGIIGMASPMLQEVFGGRLIGVNAPFEQLNQAQHAAIATLAAGFTGLLSLFNIAGRFSWASLSDYIGRKTTYMVFFLLGIVLYASIPWTAAIGSLALFVGFFCIILSMYGGGFATVPADLADLFGTRVVGAIHGRLLTAWSAAGIFGPVIVNYLREYQLSLGMAHAQVYTITMYILAGLLVVGLICNSLVRPVDIKHFMTPAEEAALDARDAQAAAAAVPSAAAAAQADPPTPTWKVTAAWLAVGIPLAWGVWVTLRQAAKLFGGG